MALLLGETSVERGSNLEQALVRPDWLALWPKPIRHDTLKRLLLTSRYFILLFYSFYSAFDSLQSFGDNNQDAKNYGLDSARFPHGDLAFHGNVRSSPRHDPL